MSEGAPGIAGAAAARDAARDWQAVRDSAEIQFSPVPQAPPPEVPGWLKSLTEWLRSLFEPVGEALGLSWPVIEKVLIGLAVLGAAVLFWRICAMLWASRRSHLTDGDTQWQPERKAAQALLEDADRLAAEGRYGEAAHLLLQRSVVHIGEARPGWLVPASTAREIAALPMLPEQARAAFAAIATLVERSLFALRELERADWQVARAAYADFALAELDA